MRFVVSFVVFSCLVVCAGSAERDWTQWRGPNRDAISQETGLLKSWPEDGPERIWVYENAGSGYSSPAIAKGKLYLLGTREEKEQLINDSFDQIRAGYGWLRVGGP